MQTDPLSDFLTTLRNASRTYKKECVIPYSRLKSDVAHVLKKEGYLLEVETIKTVKAKPSLKVTLRFTGKAPAFAALKRVSKPGLRRYVDVDSIPRVLGGMGIAILSTPKGVLSGHEAKKQNVGGELLLTVY